MRHIVQWSGGAGSAYTAWLVAQDLAEGDTLELLFADVKMEDEDTYRFSAEAAAAIPGAKLVTLADGRTPWEVFRDERYLGNTRVDPCSKHLKRELIRRWLDDNVDPADAVIYLGIDWTEAHRYENAKPRWAPFTVRAPMVERTIDKDEAHAWVESQGIKRQRLYEMGFPHANCGGFCVKAGQAHFELLLRSMPERYAFHERQEQELRALLGKDVAILRDRRGGDTKPLTLRSFRERLGVDPAAFDSLEWGGCACFTPDHEDD